MTLWAVSTVVALHGASYLQCSYRVSLAMLVRRRGGELTKNTNKQCIMQMGAIALSNIQYTISIAVTLT